MLLLRNSDLLKLKVSLKSPSPALFFGSSNSRYHWVLKVLVATWKSEDWEQKCAWRFYYFYSESNYDVLKPKSPSFLLNKYINFNKIETKSKMKNPKHSFRVIKEVVYNLLGEMNFVF